MAPGPPGVSREAKLSPELEFGAKKLGPESRNFEEVSKNHHFLTFFMPFMKFFELSLGDRSKKGQNMLT